MAFIENEDTKIEGDLFLGSNIRITCLFSIGASAVTITIQDSAGADQVDEVSMTVIADTDSRVWEYTFQSEETDWAGIYYAFIRATNGTNISFEGVSFELIDGTLTHQIY